MRKQPIASTGIDAPAAPQVTPEETAEGGGPRVGMPAIALPATTGIQRLAAIAGRPANWRVRTKLIAILAVPMIAILVNAGLGANTVLTSTRDVNRVRDMVQVSRAATTLVNELERERTYTVGYVVDTRPQRSLDPVKAAQVKVDQASGSYEKTVKGRQNALSDRTRVAIQSVTDRLSHLANVRTTALTMTSSSSVQVAYTSMIDSLLDLVNLIPQGQDDAVLNADATAADTIARSSALMAAQQALIYGVLLQQQFDNSQYRSFVGFGTERESQISRFEGVATPAQANLYRTTVSGQDVSNASSDVQTVLTGKIGQPLEIDSQKWLKSTQVTMDLNRTVLSSLLDDTDSRVQSLRSKIQSKALLSGLLIVFILTAALLSAMVVARSLVRPLLGLRAAALDIAGHRLPEAVRRLRDATDQDISGDVEPVGIDTHEEIGEVARAFDEVHREAIRLASEQAVLRNNVNAMFVNLSRRSQGLVERQLRLIDDLENREQDPDQLSNLFKLDHLATRMRRNNESLLVLAGTDTARRWTHPVPLNEVVLAAISEVEQYTRVKQTAAASVSIAGHAVSDVVHLIAELLENATSFSPPATEVQVTSHSLGPGAGAMIEIEDRGIGMPAKDLERINERLANPPIVDVSVSRTMGLFAVGRLATRHGIRVQLRESTSGGITAVVRLPAKVVTGDPASAAPSRTPATIVGGRPPAANRPALDTSMFNGSADSKDGPVFNGSPLTYGNGLQKRGAPSNGSAAAYGNGMSNGNGAASRDGRWGSEAVARLAPPGVNGNNGNNGHRTLTDDIPFSRGPAQPDPGRPTPASADTGSENPSVGDNLDADTGSYDLSAMHHAGVESSPRSAPPPTDNYEIPRGPDPRNLLAPTDTGPTVTGPAHAGRPTPPNRFMADAQLVDPLTGPETIMGGEASLFGAQLGHQHDGTPPDMSQEFDPGSDRLSDPLDNPSFAPADDTTDESEADWETPAGADPTPIFDSVSAWFQRRSPAPALPNRRPAPPPSPVRRPGPAINRGPSIGRTDSRPSEALGRLGTRAGFNATSETTRPGPPVPPPGRIPNPAADAGQRGVTPEFPVRAGGGTAVPPVPPTEQPSAISMITSAPHVQNPSGTTEPSSWSSAADAGWQAAEAVRQPTGGGTTRSGLPMRVPMTHLVPGSAEPGPRRRPPDAPTRSPEAVGGRLASFYQGVRQGRDATSDAATAFRRDAQEDM